MRLTDGGERAAMPAHWAPTWAAPIAVGALLLVFGLDRATGSTPVQHLYYLPIILAGLRFGTLGMAVSAIVLYHVANPHLLTFKYGESDVVQIALFLAVGAITARLSLDARRLRQLALTDDLTGLHNLRSFEAQLAPMVRAGRATKTPLALLVLDVDHLKALNDEYGHLTGAEAVRTVGRIIGRHLPPDAVACRYGGDEFAIAIPRGTSFLAHRVGEELRRAVYASAPVLAGRAFPVGTLSVSIGAACASFPQDARLADHASNEEIGEALFRAADAALYRAKASGRNRVFVA